MARFYANENFPRPVVEQLRKLGHDLLTVHDTLRPGQRLSDEQVLAFAAQDGRAVLTFDRRDFTRLHAESAAHGGIVTCTIDLDFGALACRIHEAVKSYETLSGRLIRVVRPN